MAYFCEGFTRLISVRRWADFSAATGGFLTSSNIGDVFSSVAGREMGGGIGLDDNNGNTVQETLAASFSNIGGSNSESSMQCQLSFKFERPSSTPTNYMPGTQELISFPGALGILPFQSTGDAASSPSNSRRFRISLRQWDSSAGAFTGSSAFNDNLYLSTWYTAIFRVEVTAGVSAQYELKIYRQGDFVSPVLDQSGTVTFADASNPFLCRIGVQENQSVDDWVIKTGSDVDAFSSLPTPVVVDSLLTSANGTTIQWTPSNAGDNYTNVDDVGADLDSDQVAATTSGQVDLYRTTGTTAQIPTGADIEGVTAHGIGLSPDGLSIKVKMRPASTTVDVGTNQTLTTGDTTFARGSATNPDGGGAWTKALLDATEFGIELV